MHPVANVADCAGSLPSTTLKSNWCKNVTLGRYTKITLPRPIGAKWQQGPARPRCNVIASALPTRLLDDFDRVSADLLAQRIAVQTEQVGSPDLVAAARI